MSSLFESLRNPGLEKDRRGWIYSHLGVDPIVNCAGTRSTFGGSNPSEIVRQAMAAASEAFVDLDELAEAAGRRIRDITGAEWGIVTAGSAASLAISAAASMAGNDPAALIRLPDTVGLKRAILIPETHRFPYDLIVRSVGAELITFKDLNELTDLTADASLICLLGRAEQRDASISLEAIRELVGDKPIVVDAAGLSPARPDPWLIRGADLVIYSGGKYLQGPQSTGFLIGAKWLCAAAYASSSPHTSICRGMKVGKEEIVGALAALEQWLAEDNLNERQSGWLKTLDTIAAEAAAVFHVNIVQPTAAALTPRLRLSWDGQTGFTAGALVDLLRNEYRIQLSDFLPDRCSVEIDPFNLIDRDEAIFIGRALVESFKKLAGVNRGFEPSLQDVEIETMDSLAGNWTVTIDFGARSEQHRFRLAQQGTTLAGQHEGRLSSGTLIGAVEGETVSLVAVHPAGPMDVFYTFEGLQEAEGLEGVVFLGAAAPEHRGPSLCRQFGRATWFARRARSAVEGACRATQ